MKELLKAGRDTVRLGNGLFSHALGMSQGADSKFHQSLVNLFCYSGGYSNDLLSLIVRMRRGKLPFEKKGIIPSLTRKPESQVIQELKKDGYFVFENRISQSHIDSLTQIARNSRCIINPADSDLHKDGLVTADRFDENDIRGVKYALFYEDLANQKVIQKLISDPSLLSTVQAYIGSQPILYTISMWWSAKYGDKPDSPAAQLYHFDMDTIRWIKFFIYLEDVDSTNGPHTFVRGSHQSGAIPQSLLKAGYARLTDSEISKHFSKDDVVELKGCKGTVMLVDTRGLHKGKILEKGHRLIFELDFCNCLLGAPTERVRFRSLEPELEESVRKFPRVYSNFETT